MSGYPPISDKNISNEILSSPSKPPKSEKVTCSNDSVDKEEREKDDDYMTMALPEEKDIPSEVTTEKDLERDAREEALAKAEGRSDHDRILHKALRTSLIHKDPENKGLKIMKMMGFKAGSRLGVAAKAAETAPALEHTDEQNQSDKQLSSSSVMPVSDAATTENAITTMNSSTTEPIFIVRKLGRGGIGYDSARQQELARSIDEQFNKQNQEKTDFQARVSQNYSDKKLESHIKSAQRVCIDLDARAMAVDPEEIYDSNDIKSLNILYRGFIYDKQMNKKVNELRRQVDNPAYEPSIPEIWENEAEPESDNDLEEFRSLDKAEQLCRILTYLRNTHYYCLWCGCPYDNADDLQENCPGMLETDH